jgi:hypothetical protein
MMEVTNADRADWARAAVQTFRQKCAGTPLNEEGGLQEAVGDLIVDLCHLARRECGVEDVEHFLSLKSAMHNTEVKEDPEE